MAASITLNDPGGTYSAYYSRIISNINAAWALWQTRVLADNVDVEILVNFQSLGGTTLASARAGYLASYTSVYKTALLFEIDHFDLNGTSAADDPNFEDIEINIDVDTLVTDIFYFETDFSDLSNSKLIPSNQIDFFTVILHELGHGIGIANGTTVATTYNQWVVESGGQAYFTGPNTVATAGEDVLLASTSDTSHYNEQKSAEYDSLLMTPIINRGVRQLIGALDHAILADVGFNTLAWSEYDTSVPVNETFNTNDLGDFANLYQGDTGTPDLLSILDQATLVGNLAGQNINLQGGTGLGDDFGDFFVIDVHEYVSAFALDITSTRGGMDVFYAVKTSSSAAVQGTFKAVIDSQGNTRVGNFGVDAGGKVYVAIIPEGAQTLAYSATATLSQNNTPTGGVSIDGLAVEDQTLTADISTVTDADGLGEFYYQWYANGSAIASATASSVTLSQAQVGKTISLTLTYTDLGGTVESLSSVATAPVANVNDAPEGLPQISGVAKEDGTLSLVTNAIEDEDGLGSFSYQWFAGDNEISGATETTLLLTQSEVGETISARVYYVDGQGTAEELVSAATAPVENINDSPTGSLVVSGTAREDETLSTILSDLEDEDGLGSLSYQWLADGEDITGANLTTLYLGQALVGAAISVQVRYTDGQGTEETLSSDLTTEVINLNDAPTGGISISGSAIEDQTLSIDTAYLADEDGLGTFSYRWYANNELIVGETLSTLVLGQSLVGKTLSAGLSYTDGQGQFETLTSTVTAPVTNLNDEPTGSALISGLAQEDEALTFVNQDIADEDGLGTFSYQWYADGSVIDGADTATLILGQSEVGKSIRLDVSYTDDQGNSETVQSDATALVANINDVPQGYLTISGVAAEDQTLVSSVTGISDEDGIGTFSYQWYADDELIDGATGASYRLTQAEVGSTLYLQVSYTDDQGTVESLTSSTTLAVTNVNDLPVGMVTINGIAQEDELLSADLSALVDEDGLGAFSYQWFKGDTEIAGATSSSLLVNQALVGAQLKLRVSYTDLYGASESLFSAPTSMVANLNDAPQGAVVIDGSSTVNQTLTANTAGISDADGLGNFSYQWFADGSEIAGAVGKTLTLSADFETAQISVRVDYVDGFGTAESLQSGTTDPVLLDNNPASGELLFVGDIQEDSTVILDSSGITDVDGLGSFDYQWFLSGEIAVGETTDSFTFTQAHVGKILRAQVSFTDGEGNQEVISTTTNPVVLNLNDNPVGLPTISGLLQQGEILTGSAASISDEDGIDTLGFQWLADGEEISGASSDKLILTQALVGKPIQLRVYYTDLQGTAETLTSSATVSVVNLNDAPIGSVSISGSPTEGQRLSANTSAISDADGLGEFEYQWYADGEVIAGANEATYMLSQADVGSQMSVEVSYTDLQGTAEILASASTSVVANVNNVPSGTLTLAGNASQYSTLTLNENLVDQDGLGALSVKWFAGGVEIPGATGNTLLLEQAQVGLPVLAEVSYTDGYGKSERVQTLATEAVANVNDTPVGSVTLLGEAQQGQTLRADLAGVIDLDGPTPLTQAQLYYQWHRDGVLQQAGDGSSYLLAQDDVGKEISLTVSYTDALGTAESLMPVTSGSVANTNDLPTGPLLLNGLPARFQVLSLDTSQINDLDGLGAFSYQWYADDQVIAGANQSTLSLTFNEVDKRISASISYTDTFGASEQVSSSKSSRVTFVNAEPSGEPVVIGSAVEDSMLSINVDSLSDIDGIGSLSFSWYANGQLISGADSATLTLGQPQVGKTIQGQVKYTDGNGTVEILNTSATSIVQNINDPVSGFIRIGGTPAVGQYVYAQRFGVFDEDGLGYFRYQWFADGAAIAGATRSSFYPSNQHMGQDLQVRLSFVDKYGSNESLLSDTRAVSTTNAPTSGHPSIFGEYLEGESLTLSISEITDVNGIALISYTWFANGQILPGETSSTLRLGSDLVGKTITGRITVVDGLGAATEISALQSGVVERFNHPATGSVTIVGAAVEYESVSALGVDVADEDGVGEFTYNWFVDGKQAFSGQLFDLSNVQPGSALYVELSFLDDFGTVETLTSDVLTVANVNDAPVGTLIINGDAVQHAQLTVDTSNITDKDGVGEFSFQWLADDQPIYGETGDQVVLSQSLVGRSVSVEVQYIDGFGTAERIQSESTEPVANVNDLPSGRALLLGDPVEDATLTLQLYSIEDLDGLGEFVIVWQRNGETVEGARGLDYRLDQIDVGSRLSALVTYTDGFGSDEELLSNSSGVVQNLNDPATGDLAILGELEEDQQLFARISDLVDEDGLGELKYQWFLDGDAIAGANQLELVLDQSLVGGLVSFELSFTDGQGTPEILKISADSTVANVNDPVAGEVLLKGEAIQGNELIADTSMLADEDGLGSFRYQWFSESEPIANANSASLVLTQKQVDKPISVEVSYTDNYGSEESVLSRESEPVKNIDDPSVGSPVILGVSRQGASLLAEVSTITDPDGISAFNYQWLRDGVDIPGADRSSYLTTQDDVNSRISVRVSYVDDYGGSETLSTSLVSIIANVNDDPVGLPLITGEAFVGETLLVDTASISDLDGLGTFYYQWYSDDTLKLGETSPSYTLTEDDLGAQLSLRLLYIDGFRNREILYSAPSARVALSNQPVEGELKILGSASQGQVLTADTSKVADQNGLGAFTYQWMRDGEVLPEVRSNSYLLDQADVGGVIGLVVSFEDGGGYIESLSTELAVAVANVNDTPQGKISIIGSPIEGEILALDLTGISDADGLGEFNVQWLRDEEIVETSVATLYLTQTDVSSQISVVVEYVDGGGYLERLVSTATAPIQNLNNSVEGDLLIFGEATLGSRLSADVSGISDEDGLGVFSYRWYADDELLVDQKAGSLALTQEHVGREISVELSYTDSFGSYESVSSDPSAQITQKWQGNVQDGYIAGAALFIDANSNGLADEAEFTGVLTDEAGDYALVSALRGSILAVGGVNIDTGLPNRVQLSAPEGATMVTPLTTLIDKYSSQTGKTLLESQADIKARLGIRLSEDLLHFDPLNEAGADALEVQQVAAQMVTIAQANLDAQATSAADTFEQISSLVSSSSSVDLASESTIEMLVAAELTESELNKIVYTNERLNQSSSLQEISEVQGQLLSGDDNSVTSAARDEIISLGPGEDTVIYAGAITDFLIFADPDAPGNWVVLDLNTSDTDQGRDRLQDVEYVAFSDMEAKPIDELASEISILDQDDYHWDAELVLPNGEIINSSTAQLFRTYFGTLQRQPDNEGYSWWLNEIEKGNHDLRTMAAGFLWSEEFLGYVDAPDGNSIDNEVFLTHMYQGVFGREPDGDGYIWWLNELQTGTRTQVDVLVDMTQSNEYVEITLLGTADYLYGTYESLN